jgi:hypothetical protein
MSHTDPTGMRYDIYDDDYDEPCSHDCEDDCAAYGCLHEHCFRCGGCSCPGYCDDYQTYNLRPAETGAPASEVD